MIVQNQNPASVQELEAAVRQLGGAVRQQLEIITVGAIDDKGTTSLSDDKVANFSA